jgi:tRNA pseudouridine13 synthase
VDPIDGTSIPFITDDLPGIGGAIKQSPDDFRVTEQPLYEPDGEGQHLYVRLRRRGMTTEAVSTRLQEHANVDDVAIGYAGKKDKNAVATQTFSVDLPGRAAEPVVDAIEADEQLTLVEHAWHRNKLQRGHLIGNAFEVVIRDVDASDPQSKARDIIDRLQGHGLPNYYGPQRFGADQGNARRGLNLIRGEHLGAPRWKRQLFKNAYQSALFNRWLTARIDRGDFDTLLAGDIAKKTDTGGLFTVEDLEQEKPRYERGDITYTGPMYGGDLWWASDDAAEHERQILDASDTTADDLGQAGLAGSRRRARIVLDHVSVEPTDPPDSLRLQFTLPKGAYATILLRELTKNA